MDSKKFINLLDVTPDLSDTELIESVMKLAIESADKENPGRPSGHHHLDICKEECAELIQELSKETRGKGNYYNILQELADVVICTKYIQMILDIDDRQLGKAITVKIKNLEDVLINEGVYQ